MSLAFKMGSQFDRRLQDRGRYLKDAGAVRVTDQGPDHIHAVVTGSQEYTVRVTYLRDGRNRDNLLVSCTCAYFGDYSRCKHIWAVILEASRDRPCPTRSTRRFLRIDREPPRDPDAGGREPRVYRDAAAANGRRRGRSI